MSRCLAGGVEWHYQIAGTCSNNILLLIHGFAGAMSTWDDLIPVLAPHFQLLLVDLPGHGKTPIPQNRKVKFSELGQAVSDFISSVISQPISVFGYSFGGRVAMHAALFAPDKIKRLGLLGASPGILNEQAREARRKSDRELAENIRKNGVEWFSEYWANQPIFANQKFLSQEFQDKLKQSRLANDPEGLAFSLENFGTGEQEYLLPQFARVDFPVLLMAGAGDKKFCESNKIIEAALKPEQVKRVEIPKAGHPAHLEAPDLVAEQIINFFSNTTKE